MRPNYLKKAFFFCAISTLLLLLYMSLRDVSNKKNELMSVHEINIAELVSSEMTSNDEFKKSLASVQEAKTTTSIRPNNRLRNPGIDFYILQWTSPKNVPFVYMGVGNQGFIERNCTYTNCFVTSDKNYLGDYTNFDVIAFCGTEVVRWDRGMLPKKRSPHQKFAFASIESADNYPICSSKFDNFFNWTWTYKTDSDARWGYMVVRDSNGTVIGPNREMHWIKQEDMDPVSENFKNSLRTKKIAAAWFVSNCYTRSGREKFVKNLREELNKYNLTVDIYGRCGPLKCTRDNDEECDNALKRDYYFYLSFENAFSEDYATEKLVRALKNNVIPIVYGGANYTRFMPDGIYLNAREMGAEKLAKRMNELINDLEQYAEYFRWKDHYSYYRRLESIETDDYCRFCSMLNEEELVRKVTVYENFRKWWDPPDRC